MGTMYRTLRRQAWNVRLATRQVRTVFLDRDGTINVKAREGAYIREPDDVVLIPGAAPALARLNRAGITTVLVTNQRWISQPGADPVIYEATHRRLVEL